MADVAEEFIAAEDIVMKYVKAPGPKNINEYDKLRKEFQAVAGAIGKRVSRKK